MELALIEKEHPHNRYHGDAVHNHCLYRPPSKASGNDSYKIELNKYDNSNINEGKTSKLYFGGNSLNTKAKYNGKSACHSWCCIQCVRTQEVGVLENFGKYHTLLMPGLNFIFWPFQSIAIRLSLRIQQLDMICETKTKDSVFVKVGVTIQYRVLPMKAYDAHYRLTSPSQQIQSCVFDAVRSTVPTMNLDAAFASKNDIAVSVHNQLMKCMSDYGYEISSTLITEFSPDDKVKWSMNEIYACKRLKEATVEKAEAEKIRLMKNAEGEAEGRYLSGLGTARQRKALAQSFQISLDDFEDELDISFEDVRNVLLLSQYMDILGSVGANAFNLDYNPSTISILQKQLSYISVKEKQEL